MFLCPSYVPPDYVFSNICSKNFGFILSQKYLWCNCFRTFVLVKFSFHLNKRFRRKKVVRCPESRTLFENHLYSDSYKSEIVVFSPAANCSIVASVGHTWPVTMSPIVDRGTPVIIAACRIDRWCCSKNWDNNIFMVLLSLKVKKIFKGEKSYGNHGCL